MIVSPQFITDFGDGAVTGAVAVVAAIVFFLTDNKRAALAMMLAFGMPALLIAIVKLVLYACWIVSPAWLHSPSGHVALSTAVYGILTTILVSPLRARYRVPAYLLALIFVGIIAATRVVLGSHSIAEVVCGFIVGAAVYGVVWSIWLRNKPVVINPVALISITLLAIIAVHGMHLPAETLIDSIATYFGRLGHGCVK